MPITEIAAGALRLVLELDGDGPARIRDAAAGPSGTAVPLVELAADGDGHTGNGAAPLHRGYRTAARLRPVGTQAHDGGLTVRQRDDATGLVAETELRAAHGVVHAATTVRNDGPRPVRIRYLSALNLPLSGAGRGPDAPHRDLRLHIPHHSWCAELRWVTYTPEQLGLVDDGPAQGRQGTQTSHRTSATGSRSAGTQAPVAGCTDTASGRGWAWQIEHNGAWVWSLDDGGGALQLHLAGPTEQEHGWSELLDPGQRFTTPHIAVAAAEDGLDGALRALTAHRRALRRPHPDLENLPIVFNDYMNCLMGDPTREKLLPLVDAAAGLGAEYFVIDAGWYADDGGWWETVGEWRESAARFPGGLKEITDRIREAGMVPGLWVEPEVVGVRSPLAAALPEEAFFVRDGRRLDQRGRHQLDYRHPAVVAHMDAVIDRLVADYGCGYFKFDYNIAVTGTDTGAASPGAGLLGHNRAFLAWLDGLHDRHPGLVIENCSSGGLRMDYASLARMQLQSTSDQQDPVHYAPIAAAAPSGVAPEQSAVWAYPQPEYDDRLNAFTMVSALLGRVHLSGRIDLLSEGQRALVGEALAVYREIRGRLRTALPRWPLGLPGWYDEVCALRLDDGDGAGGALVAVWNRGEGEASVDLGGGRARRLFPDPQDEAAEAPAVLPPGPSAALYEVGAV
ncbi:hypothetical protein BIV57_22415 [Mangrovactinospora gilvigrisea]|uniref:Alpha-galactosidase n=1 Tax=Mangrovactinospora gilvigrisea TaxID=1428644 RepID=A0A1J7BPA0_9ACTN|nr:glycoside hydrolase family 36 protein [Mangrovactinospora gilvigrisea]OIV35273.1 hypothetical protein BIV57_22415 [Mangrovactinospora gilvigrisea]